ncbi:hypothetical protein D3C86_2025000 [compost metagenome]
MPDELWPLPLPLPLPWPELPLAAIERTDRMVNLLLPSPESLMERSLGPFSFSSSELEACWPFPFAPLPCWAEARVKSRSARIAWTG